MKDDYLWDGSGEPDPEVQQLESVLGRFRNNRPAPVFPEREPHGFPLPWALVFRPSLWTRLAAMSAGVLIIAGAWVAVRRLKPAKQVAPLPSSVSHAPQGVAPAWDVARLEGAPIVGSARIRESGRLTAGEWLETDAQSRAEISVGRIGHIEVEPNTRLRLIAAREAEGRVALELGTIQAAIWAPPGQFVVDTPSAVAVDLGCAYILRVDASGAGLLRTVLGWVGFKLDGRESFIPAGAVCATRPGIGPGTPYFEDAATAFGDALSRLDFGNLTATARAAALETVLAKARRRDALTLWHLLARLSGAERARVYDRLAALVPPPVGVTHEGALRGNEQMLDLWWGKLGFGDTSVWRTWERSWPPEAR